MVLSDIINQGMADTAKVQLLLYENIKLREAFAYKSDFYKDDLNRGFIENLTFYTKEEIQKKIDKNSAEMLLLERLLSFHKDNDLSYRKKRKLIMNSLKNYIDQNENKTKSRT